MRYVWGTKRRFLYDEFSGGWICTKLAAITVLDFPPKEEESVVSYWFKVLFYLPCILVDMRNPDVATFFYFMMIH